ncbi:MAG: Rieske 2Fe-2S domain-containing protein [Paracoccaceae bacterium]
MHYTDFPDAPASGVQICAVADIPKGGFLACMIGEFPVLVVAGPKAYVNACPHQFLPLDHRGNEVIGADGTSILCTNHGASFDLETGAGTAGLGLGCELTPIPTCISGGDLVVAE